VDPIANIRQLARLWSLKVFSLPEPTGMLMLGAGIAVLLGLSRMRRR
jgi:glutamate/tyrosine decarboxylase-like PLP-dependent enzyme